MCLLVGSLSHDHIRDVVSERVAVPEGESGIADRGGAAEDTTSQIGHIIRDICGEDFVEAIERTSIHEMAVQGEQFMDREAVCGR